MQAVNYNLLPLGQRSAYALLSQFYLLDRQAQLEILFPDGGIGDGTLMNFVEPGDADAHDVFWAPVVFLWIFNLYFQIHSHATLSYAGSYPA